MTSDYEWLEELFAKVEWLWYEYGYPVDDIAELMLYGVTGVFGMFVISLWLRWVRARSPRLIVPAVASMLIPLAILASMHLINSFRGSPDTLCTKYENGNLRYVLVNFKVVEDTGDSINDPGVLSLTVRAPDRWGDELHLCVLSLDDSKARALIEQIRAILLDEEGEGSIGGEIGFTFGGNVESPNVTWKPNRQPSNKGEQELPPNEERRI